MTETGPTLAAPAPPVLHELPWIARTSIVIPAFDAEASLPAVVLELRDVLPELGESIVVVDDGSSDGTARVARALGCTVLPSERRVAHGRNETPKNHGKGAALRTGLRAAKLRGATVALTVDADGQHPASAVAQVLGAFAGTAGSESSFVLGVRDLVRDGAPRANRFSNGISNHFLSRFSGTRLRDTQCGLRRYPIAETLALGVRADGYDFEAEVLLRALHAGIPVLEENIRVRYPKDRQTHFRVSRDPWRILGTVLSTVAEHRIARLASWASRGGRA